MRKWTRLLAITSALVVLLLAGVGVYALALDGIGGGGATIGGTGIALAKPAVVVGDGSFLDQEAGIAAYTKIGTQIDLASAETAFRVIERQTSEWIVGTVGISGETEEVDPHVFVHQSGWIVAYYDRNTPVATALHWQGTDLGSSHLEQALGDVAANAGAPVSTVGFYNFRFPDATEWLVIVDSDSFDLTVPLEFSVFERSVALRGTDASCGSASTASATIDGSTIISVTVCGNIRRVYGGVTVSQLVPGVAHEIAVAGANSRVMAISLVFKEGQAAP